MESTECFTYSHTRSRHDALPISRARGGSRACKLDRSVFRLLQRPALVHGDVVGLVAPDLVLRIVLAAVAGVAVPVEVLHVHFGDLAADVASFGIQRVVCADLELPGHKDVSLPGSFRVRAQTLYTVNTLRARLSP